MAPLKEISRKHLAARAGFTKFLPRPPKAHFTTRIAKMEPITGTDDSETEEEAAAEAAEEAEEKAE